MSKKQWLVTAGAAGVVFLLTLWAFGGTSFTRQPQEALKNWNRSGVRAVYMATQLREVDKTRAALILSYDLSNMSNVDYRLTDGSGVVIMSRLKSDGSLSQEQRIRLSYPVFLPAGQRAHLAFEITREFVWPKDDSHHDEKLKEFVRQMLAPVRGFVLFDDSSHSQFDLPAGWPDLQETSETRPRG
ncbi:MAG: hypothetical protein AUH13_10555 [Acidobacteria bacterium 13_2_20CM_58_27]|nr:MAG: hypothetical protein AUH13_10555 [Acidobacteria bacterium 13_2_20CM_58_27]